MSAIEKTKMLERRNIAVHLIDPNPNNPNEMTDAQFNMLSDNMELVGFTDPLLVRPKAEGRYETIGGHHRLDVAKIQGFDEVPCTIITDPEFSDDLANFQVVRMNIIRGKMNPEKFMKMYDSMKEKYQDETLIDMFGFAEEEEFRKLVRHTGTTLPKELQKEFQAASKELKTIDDLAKLLNRLFTTYGDTLPFGYMMLDFGGKDSIWLRMTNQTRDAVLTVGKRCCAERRSVDDLIGGVIRMMAEGKLEPQLVQLIAQSPEVQIPVGVTLPTQEVLNPAA